MSQNKGYKTLPLSLNRRAVMASATVSRTKNIIHCLTEADISRPRALIREYFGQTGTKLSLTAYIVACLADTLNDFPDFNSFVKGGRLIMLDDITISVLIEREISGERVPEPLAIRSVQQKSIPEIHGEIREAQQEQTAKLGSLSGHTWIRFIPGFLMRAFIRLADMNIPMAKKYGKVAVTAVGMFSREPFWFVPHGGPTVLVTIGSIANKVVEIEEQMISREHLCLTLSFNHDIVDGAPASRFVNQFIQTVKSGRLVPAV